MATTSMDWRTVRMEILSQLDLLAEYKALGLEVTGKNPTAKGWLECRAIDREDRSPSCGINVAGSPEVLGSYKDFVSGDYISFWDFCLKHGNGKFPDFGSVIKHFAGVVGVKLGRKEPKRPADLLAWLDPRLASHRQMLAKFCEAHGVTPDAVAAMGGRIATYPADKSAELRQDVMAFPIWAAWPPEGEPEGFVLMGATGQKLRHYRGKGAEPEYLKKKTIGGTGLLVGATKRQCVDCGEPMDICGHWPKQASGPTLAIKTEGPTDALALLSVATQGTLVFTNACGASENPHDRWIESFKGLPVWIVGDADRPGQTGARMWGKHLASAASEVRLVKLPYAIADTHGKDLRDWLREGGDWEKFNALGAAAAKVDPASVDEIKPSDVTLRYLQIDVLGELADRQVLCYSRACRKLVRIENVDRYRYNRMLQDFGHPILERVTLDKDAAPAPGTYTPDQVMKAISGATSTRQISDDQIIEHGAWRDSEDRLLLVNSKSAHLYDPETNKLSELVGPQHDRWILDPANLRVPWYQPEELSLYLDRCTDSEWRMQVIKEAIGQFDRWQWGVPDAPEMVVGLICASWLSTTWKYRPQVFLIGESNSGKTTFFDVLASIFGPLGNRSDAPTEAAIRQDIRNSAAVPLIDEFEKSPKRDEIFKNLVRTSTRGGVRKLGSPGGKKAVHFLCRHLYWVAAIESGLTRQADQNRFILLHLHAVSSRTLDDLPTEPEYWRSLGQKLLAMAIWGHRKACSEIHWMEKIKYPGVSPRLIESLAVPAGIMSALTGSAPDPARQRLNDYVVLRSREADQESQRDHVRLLDAILAATIMTNDPSARNLAVSEALWDEGHPTASKDLQRYGVREIMSAVGSSDISPVGIPLKRRCLFLDPAVIGRKLLKGTEWEGLKLDDLLLRLPNAVRGNAWVASKTARGIIMPLDSVNEMGGEPDDDREDLASVEGLAFE